MTHLLFCLFHEIMLLSFNYDAIQLDSTTNYDERRKIRDRLRQIMADKEGTFP